MLCRKRLSVIVLAAALLFARFSCALAGPGGYVSSSTPLNESSDEKINNILIAAYMIDGYSLSYGQTFSFNEIVGARDSLSGYLAAPNGRGARVIGGGVAQVATTLYLSLLQLDDITFDEVRFYGDRFTDDYVTTGYQAIMVDYDDDYDFRFTSYYSGTLTISLWVGYDSVYCFINLDSGENGLVARASTPVYGEYGKINNIALAADSIYGSTLYSYDEFSFNDTVGPRTGERGYMTGVNGRGARVVGGGVAQVASTIYLALQDLTDTYVSEYYTYGDKYTEGYVYDSDDAIMVDYGADRDFRFVYTGSGALTIYTYISDDYLICEIYRN